mmetsp:Transcript_17063/g.24186  ORF Transcript_17063/g.24186 Transcript_17063/m.24186 type:complete len:593 (-) Transcript_17063:238-2016(-)
MEKDRSEAAEETEDDIDTSVHQIGGSRIGPAPALEEKQGIDKNDDKNDSQNENTESSEELKKHTSDETEDTTDMVPANRHNKDIVSNKKYYSAHSPVSKVGATSEPDTSGRNRCVDVTPSTHASNLKVVDKSMPGIYTSNESANMPETSSAGFSDDHPASIGNSMPSEQQYTPELASNFPPFNHVAVGASIGNSMPSNFPPYNHAAVGVYSDESQSNNNESPSIEDPPLSPMPMEEERDQDTHEELAIAGPQPNRRDHHLLPVIAAHLVEEPSEDDHCDESQGGTCPNEIFVEAEPLEKEHFFHTFLRSRTAIFWSVGILLVLVGLSIALGITLGGNTNPILITISELHDIIVNAFPNSDIPLENNATFSSPRQDALQWVLENPPTSTYNERRLVQRWVLATFFYSMSGDSWKNSSGWFSDNECLWAGLSCDDTENPNGITSISMEGNLLDGTLPPEISWFNESLLSLQLKNNNIKGTIPTEIGQLTKLRGLNLRLNSITGPIPTETGLLENLDSLRIDQNTLTGEIPSELGLLQNVVLINIRTNRLCGTMPQDICDLFSTGVLEDLQSDCIDSKVKCACCTRCWVERNPFC